MSTQEDSHHRPIGVTIMVVLLWVQAIVLLLAGLALTLEHNDVDLLRHADASSGTILAAGIFMMVFGVINAVVAASLGRGSRVARLLVAVVSALSLASALYSLVAINGVTRGQSVMDIIVALAVLYILFQEKGSREFFED